MLLAPRRRAWYVDRFLVLTAVPAVGTAICAQRRNAARTPAFARAMRLIAWSTALPNRRPSCWSGMEAEVKRIDESMLVAYVDGELDDRGVREIKAEIAHDPEAQAGV